MKLNIINSFDKEFDAQMFHKKNSKCKSNCITCMTNALIFYLTWLSFKKIVKDKSDTRNYALQSAIEHFNSNITNRNSKMSTGSIEEDYVALESHMLQHLKLKTELTCHTLNKVSYASKKVHYKVFAIDVCDLPKKRNKIFGYKYKTLNGNKLINSTVPNYPSVLIASLYTALLLFSFGFGNDDTLHTLTPVKFINNVTINRDKYPQEHEFLNGININCPITYQHVELMYAYLNRFGRAIELAIPRSLICVILETDAGYFRSATCLIIASLVGCLELVKYFMNNDKNIKYKLSFDKSCSLVYVTQRRNPSAIKYVSDNDGNINATAAQSESYLNAPGIFNEGGGFYYASVRSEYSIDALIGSNIHITTINTSIVVDFEAEKVILTITVSLLEIKCDSVYPKTLSFTK